MTEMKQCPYCSEEILASAKKCKHCNEFLDAKYATNYQGLKVSSLHVFSFQAPRIFCPNCKYEGTAKRTIRGSLGIELVLWCVWIVPGLIYHLWRNQGMAYACPKCGFKGVQLVSPATGETAAGNGQTGRKPINWKGWAIVAGIGLVIVYLVLNPDVLLNIAKGVSGR